MMNITTNSITAYSICHIYKFLHYLVVKVIKEIRVIKRPVIYLIMTS